MRIRVVEYLEPGLVVKAGRRSVFTVAYGEILTAERVRHGRGLRLHTRTTLPLDIRCDPEARLAIEDEIRARGVRVVDEYGAMITPTLEQFTAELARGPAHVRQSSDSA